MIFQHRAFWLPKDVRDPQAYEDAFQIDGQRGLAAVCDGVSSTIFSGRWASIVANAVVQAPPRVHDAADLEAWLKRNREAWSTAIGEQPLAWHQKAKLLEGAGTTLLWVQVCAPSAADRVARPFDIWSYAIGDCCLFHIRANQVLQSFPIQNSSRFEENPQVIRSVYKRSDVVSFEAMETQCHPGDMLALCTDAIAWYTMRQLEQGREVDWERFWHLSNEQWQRWVVQLRQQNQIRFDDSTMVLLRVGAKGPAIRTAEEREQGRSMSATEERMRGAIKSLRGSLRKGLKELSESKWLKDSDSE
jgi:hypothetical protein